MVKVRVVDMMRGIAVVMFVFGHFGQQVFVPQAYWEFALVYPIVEFTGSASFLLVSGIAFTFSVRSRLEKNKRDPSVIRPPMWQDVNARSLLLLIIAIAYNAIAARSLWIFYILQTIAVSRLLMYPLRNTSVRTRVVLIILIIALSPLLYLLLYPGLGAGIAQMVAFNLLFNLPYLDVIFPFFAFFLAGTLLGDMFWDRRNFLYEKGYSEMANFLLKMGGILLVTGVCMGLYLTNWSYGWDLYSAIVMNPGLNWSGLPLFLVRCTPPWMVLSTGEVFIVLGLLCYAQKFVRVRSADSRFLSILGTQSLTIYLWHYAGIVFFTQKLDQYTAWFVDIAYVAFCWAVTWIWVKKYNSKYSIEWLMAVGIKLLFRKYDLKPTRILPPPPTSELMHPSTTVNKVRNSREDLGDR